MAGNKEFERLSGPIHPMPAFTRGTQVKVYVGAGWAKGTVEHRTREMISVWLPQARRTTRCHDARNIQRA